MSQAEWTPRSPDTKEGLISLQWLKLGSSFISHDEDMSESPVETLEKAVGVRLMWRVAHITLTPREAHEFNAS